MIRALWLWLFGPRPEETPEERREKLAWKIIASQIAETSKHHP
jgi:hypothetical protein